MRKTIIDARTGEPLKPEAIGLEPGCVTREERMGLDAVERFPIMRTPVPDMIPRGPATERLYKHEEARNARIGDCAKEWLKLTGTSEKEFWTAGIPQALFDTLTSWQPESALLAAEAFLKIHGWKVTRPGSPDSPA